MKLTHIGISQFRSIGPKPVLIDLTKRITVLVGQNDSGKSNVLVAMKKIGETLRSEKTHQWSLTDYHKRIQSPPQLHLRGTVQTEGENPDSRRLATLSSIDFTASLVARLESGIKCEQFASMDEGQFLGLCTELGIRSGYMVPTPSAISEMETRAALHYGRILFGQMLAFHIIPQFRRIEKADKYSVDGKGIIDLLAVWQHPAIGDEFLKKKFDRVELLLRQLLGRPEACLEVPSTQKEIIVRDGNMRLPLESHGTGVHQLIILAIAVLSQDDVIFGIEEPEVHLHPLLQKRFLQFLLRETTNKYLITTHSPALIAPSNEVAVIHLKMADGATLPTYVQTDAAALATLDDLGIQPSDLLQANSVIWVEGPSDRIYLKRWIELLYPRLVEGLDYSIMFYGGRLLAHLSMEREETELTDFVKLLRINQRSALVMDSDRGNAQASLNETKQRIIDECERNEVHSWVTDGREIENYLTGRTVMEAIKEEGLLDGDVTIKPFVKFDGSVDNGLRKPKKSWCEYGKHKATWAHRFAAHIEEQDMTPELKGRLQSMIKMLCPSAD